VLVTFRGGRLPAQPARPHLKYAAIMPAHRRPAPPDASDWISTVPADLWGMLGNDEWGDCAWAGLAHDRIGDVWANQSRRLDVRVDDVLAAYSAVTGFDPDAGAPGANPTDRGTVLQDALKWWQRTGFLGVKIAVYAKLDVSDLDEVKSAIDTFGQIYTGLNVPTTAMAQFDAGQPWDVVRGARTEGGHCVTVGAYDPTGLSAVTWGKVQRMTWAFWRHYFDEAWVTLSSDDIDPDTGRGARGLDLPTLRSKFTDLTSRHVGLAA
jgi:hypothetical protein